MDKWLHYIQPTFLIIAALGGVAIGTLDLFGVSLQWLKGIPSYSLVLLGIIALSAGLEKISLKRGIESRVEEVLKESVHCRKLKTFVLWKATMRSMIQLVNLSERQNVRFER
ncbi:MAG TPA: hypothetical protein VFA07_13335 [Chthonomonadaceae bacterium]|nr:hypothetical protein [Chthonomonadaceae bacterium]